MSIDFSWDSIRNNIIRQHFSKGFHYTKKKKAGKSSQSFTIYSLIISQDNHCLWYLPFQQWLHCILFNFKLKKMYQRLLLMRHTGHSLCMVRSVSKDGSISTANLWIKRMKWKYFPEHWQLPWMLHLLSQSNG